MKYEVGPWRDEDSGFVKGKETEGKLEKFCSSSTETWEIPKILFQPTVKPWFDSLFNILYMVVVTQSEIINLKNWFIFNYVNNYLIVNVTNKQ